MNINAKGQFVRDDLTGFEAVGGCFKVTGFSHKTSNGGSKYNCECKATGTRFEMWSEVIKRGSKWCPQCRKKAISVARTTHGMRHTGTYNTWSGLHTRCENENSVCYSIYGGRGITVDPRWDKFENFLEDMGERPDGTTLERVDNNKGYCKENCRWATRKEQAQNRRTNKTLTLDGQTLNYSQWSEKLGIDKTTIRKRVLLGWPVEKVLTKGKFHKSDLTT